jgi:uridine kinase
MENYSIEMNRLPLKERAKMDYDAPHAIDVELLERHIRDYAIAKVIEAPVYDFAAHLRVSDQHEHILEATDEICFHRRKVRDITERQRSLDFILWQYKNTVLPGDEAVRAPQQALCRSRPQKRCGPASRGEKSL